MKTVGKTMKVTHNSKASETRPLRDTLTTYLQTPHPATGISLANMVFRDGIKSQFVKKSSSDSEVMEARKKDENIKTERQEKVMW